MKNRNRRKFLKDALQSSTIMALATSPKGILTSVTNESSPRGATVHIPMPIQVVIDDVGWWSGEDGNEKQEPYRSGIGRNHTVADYEAIVRLGKALDIRPQAAMILCEWDKENILRSLPNITWMGEQWDNSKWVGPWLEEAADIIRSNERNFELTIHGVGHEYWENGKFTRAEWATQDGTMRPPEQVEKHLDYFARIMDQNDLGSFPTSFVPTAFNHGFGLTGNHSISMAELLKRQGVNYINTPFSQMQNSGDVKHGLFGFDAGVMTIDRGEDLKDWNVVGEEPTGNLSGPTCGMHWPNLLHRDPERNSEVVDGWVKFLAPYDKRADTMLAPNSVAFQHQLVHYVCTKAIIANDSVAVDFTETDIWADPMDKSTLSLKIESPIELDFASTSIKIISEYSIKGASSFIYTLQLERKTEYKKASISFTGK